MKVRTFYAMVFFCEYIRIYCFIVNISLLFSPCITENIAKIDDSVNLIIDAATSSNASDKATALASLDKVKELLALLAGVVEGSEQ